MLSSQQRTRQAIEPLAVLPVALLATVTLWWPESPDQSLFNLAAQQLRTGAVYYRDLWDLKQPGIYWFYELGEWLVPGGLGTRILEGLLAVIGAGLVSWITSGWGLRRSVRLVAPLIVFGPYLLYSVLAGAGEIEGVMNVLLLAVLACCWPTGQQAWLRPGGAWFVAGLVVGTVVVLKTLYTPIPLVLLAGAALAGWRSGRRDTLLRLGLALLGALLPVLVTIGYLAAHGVLGVAMMTTFSLPFQVVAQPGLHDQGHLPELARAVKNMFAVAGPLAIAGLLGSRRRGQLLLCATLAVTAVVALVLALPQLSTPYRWLMLAAPVGLLAVAGLEQVLCWLDQRAAGRLVWPARAVAGLVAAGLTVPLVQPAAGLLTAGQQRWGLDDVSRIARGENADPVTRPVTSAALVSGKVAPGSRVYVLGDARIQVLLGAPLSVPVSGLSMHLMPAAVWSELSRELETSRPTMIYVGSWNDGSVTSSGAGQAVWRLLDRHYRRIASSPLGSWYRADEQGVPLVTGYRPFAESG